MSKTGPTPADRDLARRASTPNYPITPGQAEDWREQGFFHTPRRYRGPNQGLEAVYGADAVKHLRYLTRAIKRYRRKDEAVLDAFVHRFRPRERGLKWAYRSAYKRILPSLRPTHQEAERAARQLSGQAARGKLPAEIAPIFGPVVTRVEGWDAGADVLTDIFANIFGLGSGLTDYLAPETALALGGPQPDREEFAHFVHRMQALPEIVEGASLEELEQARDLYLDVPFSFDMPPVTIALLVVPMFVVMLEMLREQTGGAGEDPEPTVPD